LIVIMALGSLSGCFRGCSDSAPPIDGNASPATAAKDGQGTETDAVVPVAEERRRIVFFGDSLTSGYGLPDSESFPAQIQRLIVEASMGWEVINAGVAGDTSQGGLERVDWVLTTKPDLLFLCLGANDGLRGITPEVTERNLLEIVRRVKAAGVPVLVAGMRMPTNYGAERNASYEAVFERVSQQHNAPFLPFLIEGVALEPSYNQPDGIHPNREGARLVAERVFGFIRPFLVPSEQ
jgi:acyl-CoA thioesterase-1